MVELEKGSTWRSKDRKSTAQLTKPKTEMTTRGWLKPMRVNELIRSNERTNRVSLNIDESERDDINQKR